MACVECSGLSDLCSQGKLVYGNYGRQEDLEVVQKNDIELKGSVLLLRTGKLSFAEQVCALMWRLDTPRVTSSVFQGLDLFSCFLIVKVDNAATKGASAVLIYPDTKDYNYRGDTPLFGHVSLHTQVPMLGLSRDEGSRHLALRHIVFVFVCVCPHSGSSGFGGPLHPWVPILQPYPVRPDTVVWLTKNPSSDHHRRNG